MQKPDATLVAGYTAWKKLFGRQVQKGESGIRILAPAPYKKTMEVDKTDPATGKVITKPDGTAVKETKEVLMPAFKVVSVFDVSQTEGKPLPSIGVNELTGDVKQYDLFLKHSSSPVRYQSGLSRSKAVPRGIFTRLKTALLSRKG